MYYYKSILIYIINFNIKLKLKTLIYCVTLY